MPPVPVNKSRPLLLVCSVDDLVLSKRAHAAVSLLSFHHSHPTIIDWSNFALAFILPDSGATDINYMAIQSSAQKCVLLPTQKSFIIQPLHTDTLKFSLQLRDTFEWPFKCLIGGGSACKSLSLQLGAVQKTRLISWERTRGIIYFADWERPLLRLSSRPCCGVLRLNYSQSKYYSNVLASHENLIPPWKHFIHCTRAPLFVCAHEPISPARRADGEVAFAFLLSLATLLCWYSVCAYL